MRNNPTSMSSKTLPDPLLISGEASHPSTLGRSNGNEQLNSCLSDLNLLVITLPLTPTTHNMLSKEQFDIMSKIKTFVSNVERGAVINTDALIAALDGKQIRGAALDVTEPEPLNDDSKLRGYENAITIPHCAGNSNHFNKRTLKILRIN